MIPLFEYHRCLDLAISIVQIQILTNVCRAQIDFHPLHVRG